MRPETCIVSELFGNRVLMWPPVRRHRPAAVHRSAPTRCLAVDKAGTVYATDWAGRVQMLPPAAVDPIDVPFVGLAHMWAVWPSMRGRQRLRGDMPNEKGPSDPRSSSWRPERTPRPCCPSRLQHPYAVAGDGSGTVYVTDTKTFRVLKLTMP
jgi:hypothetical protein